MNPEKATEELLFEQAIQRPAGPERQAFLDQACANNQALRQRLEALLGAHDNPASAIESSAGVGVSATRRVTFADEEGAGTVIGPYKILEKLGEGGFGVVYVAEQRTPVQRRVALKVIKLGMDTRQVIARFEAERQALAMMDHPNIAKVLDAGATATGRPYFVMELVRGIKLTEYCDQNKLTTRERLDLFNKVCQAMQHAHQKGIIHRDIKPSNILVTLHDGVPVPKVIDFGIAKATEGRLTDLTVYTELHQFIGTPAYTSPEQAEMSGLDIDTRSDIYSLGVLLYELLTGCTPFDGKELVASGLDAMRRTIREKDPLRPSNKLNTLSGDELTTAAQRRGIDAPKLINLLSGDLDWIVMRCLEKDRTRRYETANGLATDLKRFMAHEPVIARPPSPAYRLTKAIRRNRLAFAATTAIIVALLVGTFVSTWQAILATHARHEADSARHHESELRNEAQANEKKTQLAQAAEARQRRLAEGQALNAERSLYVATMNLTQQAWERNNASRVTQLLNETEAYADRGFEYFYWQRQLHLELKTFRGHDGIVWSVAFSPDGKRIITGSNDKSAKLWDVTSGKEILTFKGHNSQIYSVAYSPDGKRVVTGSLDQTAKVWDASSGKELLTLEGHGAPLTSVAFSPDGRRIATSGGDDKVKVWDAVTGNAILTLSGHSNTVWSVAYATDGLRIVTASWDKTAKVWDATTGNLLLTLVGHDAELNSANFSADGKKLVTGSVDHTAVVWESISGKKLLTLKSPTIDFRSVKFSPDGKQILSCGWDPVAQIWDSTSGEQVSSLRGHSGPILSVAFSPDGRQVVTGSVDATAKLWDASPAKKPINLAREGSWIMSAACSPDGLRIVTGSSSGTIEVIDAGSGTSLFRVDGHKACIASVAFSPDGRKIISGSYDLTAKLWDTASGKELVTMKDHEAAVFAVAFSPDGSRIVTCSADGTSKVRATADGTELLALKEQAGAVLSVTFSPDGKQILTGNWDGTAKVWEAGNGKELLSLDGHGAGIWALAFSPDGSRIITGGEDAVAKMWDSLTGKTMLTLAGHTTGIRSVAFSPDGRRIVTGSADTAVKVWDTVSGKALLSLDGQNNRLNWIAFSADGLRILMASQILGMWEAASPNQVAAWKREDSDREQRLHILTKKMPDGSDNKHALQTQEVEPIKDWLLLAPIPYEGKSGLEALQREQIAHEANPEARLHGRVDVGQGERVWRAVRLTDNFIDFSHFVGELTEWSVAYAVCYIQSDFDQAGLLMKVGSDDQSKVYLNGKEIYRREKIRSYVADQDIVTGVNLKAGPNVLVFKVVNETATWFGSISFTAPDGGPINGIRVTLSP